MDFYKKQQSSKPKTRKFKTDIDTEVPTQTIETQPDKNVSQELLTKVESVPMTPAEDSNLSIETKAKFEEWKAKFSEELANLNEKEKHDMIEQYEILEEVVEECCKADIKRDFNEYGRYEINFMKNMKDGIASLIQTAAMYYNLRLEENSK